MEKMAIIGASYLQLPLAQKAHQMGIETICFAWSEGAVCAEFVDKFYPISIIEKEAILEICKAEHITGVCTIASDVAAPTVAFVAEHMHLNGNSFLAAKRANDKFMMREAFASAGIKSPRYILVRDFERPDLEGLNYPLIVKPCDRSGSLGVAKVDSFKELKDALEKAISLSFEKAAIIEQYIEGREISVEFISFKGKHFPLTITDKVTTGKPHFVELEHHQPAELEADQYVTIYSTTEKALNALGITNGASHTEFRISESGDMYIIELGARMGGDFIGSDLVRLSTGYDYLKGVIDVALGSFSTPIVKRLSHAGIYFLCRETERLAPFFNFDMGVPWLVRACRTDNQLRSVSCSADRSGYLIYQSNTKVIL